MGDVSDQVLSVLHDTCRPGPPYTPEPAHLTVFGSIADGTADRISDVDLFVVEHDPVGLHGTRHEWIDLLEETVGLPVHLTVRHADALDPDEMDDPSSLARTAATDGIRLWGRPLTSLYGRWPTQHPDDAIHRSWAAAWAGQARDARIWRDETVQLRGRIDVTSLLAEGVAAARGLAATTGHRVSPRRWPQPTGLADDVRATVGRVMRAKQTYETSLLTFDEQVDLGQLADDVDQLHRLLDGRLASGDSLPGGTVRP